MAWAVRRRGRTHHCPPFRAYVDRRNGLKAARSSAEKSCGCRRIVPALVNLIVIDELVVCPLGPTSRRLIVLAGKDAYGSRDGDVGGVVPRPRGSVGIRPCVLLRNATSVSLKLSIKM
jgi:hypothetical protein